MSRYAERTRVPENQSKAEIEAAVARYGADKFGLVIEPGRAIVMFEAKNRRVRFLLPLPEGAGDKIAQERRQRWRALLLCIKAKLESVASRIETFEQAFFAHIVMPDGKTVYETAAPRIAEIYESGTMQPLLPAPD